MTTQSAVSLFAENTSPACIISSGDGSAAVSGSSAWIGVSDSSVITSETLTELSASVISSVLPVLLHETIKKIMIIIKVK
jgi:hypothetical protein